MSMDKKVLRAFWAFIPLAAMPALAQYVATPPPSQSPPGQSSAVPSAAGGNYLKLDPKNGQSEQQQWTDRYDCHRWARMQSGFDPTQQPAGGAPSDPAKTAEYRRALTACLESKGYAVHWGAAPTSSVPAAAPPPPATTKSTHVRSYAAASELKYRPLVAQIHGGYTVTTGTTDRYLDGGANVGFGFTWFPSSVLPLGLRIDGSYSRFHARNALLDLYGGAFTSGHEDFYGGDADLHLDLAHASPFFKMY